MNNPNTSRYFYYSSCFHLLDPINMPLKLENVTNPECSRGFFAFKKVWGNWIRFHQEGRGEYKMKTVTGPMVNLKLPVTIVYHDVLARKDQMNCGFWYFLNHFPIPFRCPCFPRNSSCFCLEISKNKQ